MARVFRKCNFYCNRMTESKVMANLVKFRAVLFYLDLLLIIPKSRDHGCQFWKVFEFTWFNIKF